MIDAHHHFWKYQPEEYGWIDDEMALLKRDFLPGDLESVADENGITGVISVQARESLSENKFLLDRAAESDLIKGVVGWIPLDSPDAERHLDEFTSYPLFKGVREVIQGRMDEDYFDNDAFNKGIRLLTRCGLPYDVLILENQLEAATRFIDRHPEQRFIIDHIAKPVIQKDVFSKAWTKNISELAKRENTICKFSGIVTEVRDPEWDCETVRPYLQTALECFGSARLMFGSDWPVCLLRATYAEWINTVKLLARDLSETERQQFFNGTATTAYLLK